jgi:hypothetical protein
MVALMPNPKPDPPSGDASLRLYLDLWNLLLLLVGVTLALVFIER